jgi:hypothetical protein
MDHKSWADRPDTEQVGRVHTRWGTLTPRGEKVAAITLVVAFLFFLALAGGVEL